MKYIFAFVISGFVALSFAQVADCQNLLGDALLQCMQQQAQHTTQALEENKAALEAANRRIAELERANETSGMQFYPHPCPNNICQDGVAYEWTATLKGGEHRKGISLQLEETNAKYALATAFATMKFPENRSGTDYVAHVFGTNLAENVYYFHDANRAHFDNPEYFLNHSEHGNYAAIAFNGDSAGNDLYGTHDFLIIPLNEQQQMDAKLAHAYNFGEHHVYLRVFGYLE